MNATNLDPLTGLLTRAAFQLAVEDALREGAAGVGIILIDIDEFIGFNSVLGRAAGDAALIELARRVAREVGENGLVARFADDEFAVLIQQTTPVDLADLARLCRGVVRQSIEGRYLLLTASVGTAIFPADATQGWELINQASVAQFVAKSSGRDRVVTAKPLLRTQIEKSVRDGIVERQFGLNYQPIATLGDQPRLAGVEAYLRWHHPTRGLIFPAKFLPLLEDPRLACLLGQTAINSAVAQARLWMSRRFDFGRITLNVSMHQLRGDALLADVQTALGRNTVPASRLALDLPTDIYSMVDRQYVVARLNALRSMGVSLAVESGPAKQFDLGLLKRLPITCVRLHRTFANALSPLEFNKLINAIRADGLLIIAEGIETAEQRDDLAAAGCDCAQGWGIGRSMPAPKIMAFAERLTLDYARQVA